MNELMDLKERMEHERPAQWHELPDIALYMDQIIAYMPRQLIRFDDREALTSAMVNNYIKDGLVPRAAGKRYGPIHLGYLTAVCALKKVLSVRDIGILLRAAEERNKTPEELYQYFCGISAALWIRPSAIPPPPLTRTPAGRIWPAWPWTWPCAATPTSWPAPAFWTFSSPRGRNTPRKPKNKRGSTGGCFHV